MDSATAAAGAEEEGAGPVVTAEEEVSAVLEAVIPEAAEQVEAGRMSFIKKGKAPKFRGLLADPAIRFNQNPFLLAVTLLFIYSACSCRPDACFCAATLLSALSKYGSVCFL